MRCSLLVFYNDLSGEDSYPDILEIIVHVVPSFRLSGSASGFMSPDVLVGDVDHKVELGKLSTRLLLRRLPRHLR